jgi:hypothetical protein
MRITLELAKYNRRYEMKKFFRMMALAAGIAVSIENIAAEKPDDTGGCSLKSDNHIMAKGYFVRESTDMDWEFRISGKIPSLCGIYLIVHNAERKIIHQGTVPHGNYPVDTPFVIKIPKDGMTGDYKIKIIAAQPDYLGLNLPLTNLKEVYEFQRGSIGHDKDRYLLFQVAPSQTQLTVSGYKGHLIVREQKTGKTVADTRKGVYGGEKHGAKHRFQNYITFKTAPGVVYRLEPQSFYFGFCDSTVYAMFKPDAWFMPNKKLSAIKWWRLKLY